MKSVDQTEHEPNPLPYFPGSVDEQPVADPLKAVGSQDETYSRARAQAEAKAEFHAHAYAEARKHADAYAVSGVQEEVNRNVPFFEARDIFLTSSAIPLTTSAVQDGAREVPPTSVANPLVKQHPKMGGRGAEVVRRKVEDGRKRSAVVAVAMSIAGTILICGGLYLVRILQMDFSNPLIITYRAAFTEEEELKTPQVSHLQRTPSAPPAASMVARVIASESPSAISVEMPEVNVEGSGLDPGFFGDLGVGQDWSDTFGGSSVIPIPDSGGFGRSGGLGLYGRLYDFKQNRKREENFGYTRRERNSLERFVNNIREIHRAKFSAESLEPYYRSEQELTLTHLAISPRPASEGPRYFGAEHEVKPRGWIAHYEGGLVVPETGSYRLCGMADDYLSVFIDGESWLHACWPEVQRGIAKDWDHYDESKKWLSPIGGHKLIFGPWRKFRKGQLVKMNLGVGERPGGRLGFVLMVQKKGTRYRKTGPLRRPVLPLFCTEPFSPEQREKITDSFPDYPFEWNRTLVFRPEGRVGWNR